MMRATLLVSTLFAASLVSGAALANDSVFQHGRAHGDQSEKFYKPQRDAAPPRATVNAAHTNAAGDRGTAHASIASKQSDRVNCSLDSADCSVGHAPSAHAVDQGKSSHSIAGGSVAGARMASKGTPDSKGGARVTCNEAGEGCAMSSKAAKAVWEKSSGGARHDNSPASRQVMAHGSKLNQAYSARMECNEADQCMMSSRAAAKIWRNESQKHGTLGANAKPIDDSNASAALKARMESARYSTNHDKK